MTEETPAQAEGAESSAPETTVETEVSGETAEAENAEVQEAPPEKGEETGEKPPEKKPEKTPAEKELNRLAYQARKAAAEVARERAEKSELQKRISELEKASAPPKPNLKDFDSLDEWEEAVFQWRMKSNGNAQQQPGNQPPQQPPLQNLSPEAMDFQSKLNAVRASDPQFDQRVKGMMEMLSVVGNHYPVLQFAHAKTPNAAAFLAELSKDQDFQMELAAADVYDIGAMLKGRLNEIHARKNPAKQVPASEPIEAVKAKGKAEKPEAQMSGRELRRKHGLL